MSAVKAIWRGATSAFGEVGVGKAGRIDDERPAVAEVDEVRRVPETLIDEGS